MMSNNTPMAGPDAALYYGPVKRSVTIAGHETSISLEPVFWAALGKAAGEAGLPINALIARIDAERIAQSPAANLASAIRQWLMRDKIENASQKR
jgi:predicted DNA-binding ribbon-helix-helix protein